MLNVVADNRLTAEEVLSDDWFKTQYRKKDKEEQVANEKKLFKAKILAKVSVEKNKSTICLGT